MTKLKDTQSKESIINRLNTEDLQPEIIKELLSHLQHTYFLSSRDMQKLGLARRRYEKLCKLSGFVTLPAAAITKLKYESGILVASNKGKTVSDETKLKISKGMAQAWQDDPEGHAKAAKQSKERWANMDPTEKNILLKRATDGIRKASKFGSKLEKEIAKFLLENGFVNVQHKIGVLPNKDLEFDLYIPEISSIIEVDGPSHQKAIWGDERLSSQKRSDTEKSGMAINYGFNFIRVIQTRNLSQSYVRELCASLLKQILLIKEGRKKSFYVEIQ